MMTRPNQPIAPKPTRAYRFQVEHHRRWVGEPERWHFMKALPQRFLCLAAIAIACSGCMMFRQTDRSGATGIVVDAATHSPIQSVEAAVCPDYESVNEQTNIESQLPIPSVLTDRSGRFTVPAERSVVFAPLYYFPFWLKSAHTTNSAQWASGLLVLRHDGYETKVVHVVAKASLNLGEIQMQPKIP